MSADREDILEPFGVRPMVRENFPAILIALDLPHHATDSGDLETQFETADPGEERTDSHATSISSARFQASPHNCACSSLSMSNRIPTASNAAAIVIFASQ